MDGWVFGTIAQLFTTSSTITISLSGSVSNKVMLKACTTTVVERTPLSLCSIDIAVV